MKTFAIGILFFGISLISAASFGVGSNLRRDGHQLAQTSTIVPVAPSATVSYPVITPANIDRLTPIASMSIGKGRYDKDLQGPVWSPDGKILAVIEIGDGSNDYHSTGVLLYALNAPSKPLRKLEHSDVGPIIFSPNGKYLASLGGGGGGVWKDVRLWNVESGKQEHDLPYVYNQQVSFSEDSSKLLLQTSDTGIIWNIVEQTEVFNWSNVCWPVFNRQATRMAASDCDWSGIIDVWDTKTKKKISSFQQHSLIMEMAYSPDGTILAAWDGDSKVQLWDPESGKLRAALKHLDYDSSTINRVAFSPDGNLIASWNDRTPRIQIWSTKDGKHLNSLNDQTNPAGIVGGSSFDVGFGLNHVLIVTSWADYDDTDDDIGARIWGAQTGQLLRRLTKEYSPALNPTGTLLATDSYDGSVKLWAIK